ncbi:MAG: LPXTG cell wall anchor domain-containing protein, partial [Actinomycetota bacterium]
AKGENKKSKRGKDGRDRQDETEAIPSPPAPVTPVTSSDPAGARAPDSEAPTAAFVALGAAAVLGAAGAVLIRRRRETT